MLQPSPLSLIVNNQSETPVNDTTKDCRVIGEKGLIKCKELKTVNNLTAALSVSGSFDFPSEKKFFFMFENILEKAPSDYLCLLCISQLQVFITKTSINTAKCETRARAHDAFCPLTQA